MSTQFSQHYEKVKGRNLVYITPEQLFSNSRDFGTNILDVLAESYQAFRSVMILCEELFIKSGLPVPYCLITQIQVLALHPQYVRSRELFIMQNILTAASNYVRMSDDMMADVLSKKLNDPSKLYAIGDPSFTGNEKWWTVLLQTCKSDPNAVPDLNAPTNLCIVCSNNHVSMIPTPAKGTPLKCADSTCNPKEIICDLGVTVILRNRFSAADYVEIKKCTDLIEKFMADLKQIKIVPAITIQSFYPVFRKETQTLLQAQDIINFSQE